MTPQRSLAARLAIAPALAVALIAGASGASASPGAASTRTDATARAAASAHTTTASSGTSARGHGTVAAHSRTVRTTPKSRKVRTRRTATHRTPVTTPTAPTTPTAATPSQALSAGVTLTPFEARLVYLVNQARVAAGLKALIVTPGTTDVARRWSLQLAKNDALSHNPDLVSDIAAAGSNAWTFIAENVGTGPVDDPDDLFTAYMNSPHHRANILAPQAVEIGMGAISTNEPEGDAVWNTMDFVDTYDPEYGPARTPGIAVEVPLTSLTGLLG